MTKTSQLKSGDIIRSPLFVHGERAIHQNIVLIRKMPGSGSDPERATAAYVVSAARKGSGITKVTAIWLLADGTLPGSDTWCAIICFHDGRPLEECGGLEEDLPIDDVELIGKFDLKRNSIVMRLSEW